jgi:hypothetical protein
MELKKIFSTKRIIFLLIFLAMVLIGKKINFSAVIGAENQFFTLFQFFGPIAGAFLGPVFGVISVLGAQIADLFIVGKAWSLINLVRLTPMLFAVYYFGTKRKSIGVIVPLAAMFLFIIHPVGRQAWFYSLFWLIPIIAKIMPLKYSDNVLLRSLGATFTAHAVGSTAWIWSVPMAAEQWIMLIPIVAFERLLFAAGTAGSFVVLNTVLDKLIHKFKWKIPSDVLHIDKAYILTKKLFKIHA